MSDVSTPENSQQAVVNIPRMDIPTLQNATNTFFKDKITTTQVSSSEGDQKELQVNANKAYREMQSTLKTFAEIPIEDLTVSAATWVAPALMDIVHGMCLDTSYARDIGDEFFVEKAQEERSMFLTAGVKLWPDIDQNSIKSKYKDIRRSLLQTLYKEGTPTNGEGKPILPDPFEAQSTSQEDLVSRLDKVIADIHTQGWNQLEEQIKSNKGDISPEVRSVLSKKLEQIYILELAKETLGRRTQPEVPKQEMLNVKPKSEDARDLLPRFRKELYEILAKNEYGETVIKFFKEERKRIFSDKFPGIQLELMGLNLAKLSQDPDSQTIPALAYLAGQMADLEGGSHQDTDSERHMKAEVLFMESFKQLRPDIKATPETLARMYESLDLKEIKGIQIHGLAARQILVEASSQELTSEYLAVELKKAVTLMTEALSKVRINIYGRLSSVEKQILLKELQKIYFLQSYYEAIESGEITGLPKLEEKKGEVTPTVSILPEAKTTEPESKAPRITSAIDLNSRVEPSLPITRRQAEEQNGQPQSKRQENSAVSPEMARILDKDDKLLGECLKKGVSYFHGWDSHGPEGIRGYQDYIEDPLISKSKLRRSQGFVENLPAEFFKPHRYGSTIEGGSTTWNAWDRYSQTLAQAGIFEQSLLLPATHKTIKKERTQVKSGPFNMRTGIIDKDILEETPARMKDYVENGSQEEAFILWYHAYNRHNVPKHNEQPELGESLDDFEQRKRPNNWQDSGNRAGIEFYGAFFLPLHLKPFVDQRMQEDPTFVRRIIQQFSQTKHEERYMDSPFLMPPTDEWNLYSRQRMLYANLIDNPDLVRLEPEQQAHLHSYSRVKERVILPTVKRNTLEFQADPVKRPDGIIIPYGRRIQ